jgi:cobalamin biosynthesis Mg chelatase CobN
LRFCRESQHHLERKLFVIRSIKLTNIKHLSWALLLSGVFLCASAAPASAAQSPCWKRLLNDWYDGSISKVYPLPCYHEAINHLPPDVEVYSSAKDDILAALAAASKSPTTSSAATTTATTNSTTSTGSSVTPPTTTTDLQPPKKKTGISKAIADLTPGGPDSFPLPLLILGALAILLVAAGAAGMIWRRLQEREPGTP